MRVLIVPNAMMVLALTACSPDLPSDITQRYNNGIAEVDSAFEALTTRMITEARYADLVASAGGSQLIDLESACSAGIHRHRTQFGLLIEDAAAAGEDGDLNGNAWLDEYNALRTTLGNCGIEARPSAQGQRPGTLGDEIGSASDAVFQNGSNAEFLKEFVALSDALKLYYTAVADAASGADLDRAAASATAMKDGIVAVAGTVATATGFGAPVGPLLDAVLTLVIAVDNAIAVAERYEVIEESLVQVGDLGVLDDAEVFLGLVAGYVVAETSYSLVEGRLHQSLMVFNATDPADITLSVAALEEVIANHQALAQLGSSDLPERLSSLSEAHDALTNDIVRRDGAFLETSRRLLPIFGAADALRSVIADLDP